MAKKIVVTGTRGIPDVSGGVETHVENLFPLIGNCDDYEITICCRDCYIPEDKRITSYKGCHIVYIKTPRKKSFEAIIHTFRTVIYAKKIRADIIHIHAVGPAILVPFAKILGLSVVFTHHGPDYERKKWGFMAKFMLKFGEKMGCKYADKIIVISKVIGEIVEKEYKRNDYFLIHNGVNIPEKSGKKEYIKKIGLDNSKYLLSVARFVEEKGLHDLIEAYKQWDNNDIKLVIAGDADHESEYSIKIKKEASKNKNIILTGYIKGEELNQIYTNASLFILPSYHEGLPIALLEALSYDLPVLVSDIKPNLEVGLSNHSYFKVGNTDSLSTKLTHFIDNPDNLYYDGIKEEKYNWKYIAENTARIYKSL